MSDATFKKEGFAMKRWGMVSLILVLSVFFTVSAAPAQETLNAYSIWPENWARPMFLEF